MSVIEFPGGGSKRERHSAPHEAAGSGNAEHSRTKAEEVTPDLEAQKQRVWGYLQGIMDFRNDVSDLVDLAILKSPDDAALKETDAALEEIAGTLHSLFLNSSTAEPTRDNLQDALVRGHAAAVALSLCFTSFVRAYGELVARTEADQTVIPIGASGASDTIARLLAAQTRLHDKPQLFPQRP